MAKKSLDKWLAEYSSGADVPKHIEERLRKLTPHRRWVVAYMQRCGDKRDFIPIEILMTRMTELEEWVAILENKKGGPAEQARPIAKPRKAS